MKNKFLLCLFIGVLCAGTAMAQSLTPIVIASSGGYFTSGSGSVSATVAEMTMVETIGSTNFFITHGFQQISESYLSIDEINAGNVAVFPNPTRGKFTVSIDAAENGSIQFKVFSLTGNVVLSKQIVASAGIHQFTLDISGFGAGIYLLEYTHYKTSGQLETGIVKINLEND